MSKLANYIRALSIQKILFKLGCQIPFMTFSEINHLLQILRRLEPSNCLEYGSGYSSLFFPRFMKKFTIWHSIEHHTKWAQTIISRNKRKNVQIFLCAVTPPDFSDGSYDTFKPYILYPHNLGIKSYDFVLIDGRARSSCMKEAHSLITPDGLVVLHDAKRTEYDEGKMGYTYQFLLNSPKPEGGMWFGTHSKKTRDLLRTFLSKNLIEMI